MGKGLRGKWRKALQNVAVALCQLVMLSCLQRTRLSGYMPWLVTRLFHTHTHTYLGSDGECVSVPKDSNSISSDSAAVGK